MSYLSRVRDALQAIHAADRYRVLPENPPEVGVDFSSNDYLGLSREPRAVEALHRAKQVGSGGARLLGGRSREHFLLEQELADYLGRQRALLFSSGYMAALGVMGVLGVLVNAAYSDALNHASLIDGLRRTRMMRTVYPHLQLPPKKDRMHPALIVTESLFGMDGDRIDINEVFAELHDDDILLLDEAHALGVTGPGGAGFARHLRDDRIIIMGTLSKSLGAQGGFIAGPTALIELVVNSARTFIFDTAIPPAVALAARIALYIARNADDRRARLGSSAALLQKGLRDVGFPTSTVSGPIVPVVLGSEARAVRIETELLAQKIYAPAVRPPTVPPGSSRLRISLRSDHSEDDIARLLSGLQNCVAIL